MATGRVPGWDALIVWVDPLGAEAKMQRSEVLMSKRRMDCSGLRQASV